MKTLRTAVPILVLSALAAAGCFLISGQFVVTYQLPDPLNVVNGATLVGVDVDLNTIGDYADHKDDLKRVEDLALIGDFKNNTGSTANIEVWIVSSGTLLGLTLAQVQANGVQLWGPLSVGAGATRNIDWNGSSGLFKGRQTLIDEIKGDGHFALYVIANGAFNCTVTNGAVIAVVGAAK